MNDKINIAARYVQQGNAKFTSEDYHGAIADYTRAIELDLDNQPAYFHRARAYTILGKHDLAADDRRWVSSLAILSPVAEIPEGVNIRQALPLESQGNTYIYSGLSRAR